MLAPFTAGWQTTDLNPLVIAKSEVSCLGRNTAPSQWIMRVYIGVMIYCCKCNLKLTITFSIKH